MWKEVFRLIKIAAIGIAAALLGGKLIDKMRGQ